MTSAGWKYGLSAVVAAGVTTVLGLIIRSVICNGSCTVTDRPHQYVVATDVWGHENPHEKEEVYVAPKPKKSFPELNIDVKPISVDDLSCHGPLLRLPPKFPPGFVAGNSSGFCEVSFVYGENGYPVEIDITSCTHESLEAPTRKAVQKWRGCSDFSSERQRRTSTIRYDLIDEDGKILPYP